MRSLLEYCSPVRALVSFVTMLAAGTAQTLRLPSDGDAYAIVRGPSVAIRVLRAADGVGETRFVIDARTPGVRHTTRRIVGGLRHAFDCTVESQGLGKVPLVVELDVIGPRASDGSSDLHVRATSVPEALAVSSLGIEVELRDEAGAQTVLIPTFSGAEFVEPASSIPASTPVDTRGAQSMQVTAYYADDGSGWLAYARDRAATKPKRFVYSSSPDNATTRTVRMAIEYYMPNTHIGGRAAAAPVVTTVVPYRFSPQLTHGWYPAAKLYRGYVERFGRGAGGILERGPLRTRGDVPNWMRELDLLVSEQFGWFPELSTVENPLYSLRRLRSDLGAQNILVGLWFWYDKSSPLGRFGSWLPMPQTVAQIHALAPDGIRFTGYTYPGTFDVANPLLDAAGLRFNAVHDRAGDPITELGPLDGSSQPTTLLQMDVAAPGLHDWYLLLGAFHASYSGLSGFYSDLPLAAMRADFRRPTGPVGITESAFTGYCEILERAREGARIVGKDFVSYHEAAFEWLIRSSSAGQGAVGVLGRAYPGEARTRGVPFFQTVYSGYTLFWPADEGFGTQTLLFVPEAYGDMRQSNMSRILAEGFTWGTILNSSELGLAEGKLFYELDVEEPFRSAFAHHRKTLRNLIALRRLARPWLAYGEMLASPVVKGDRVSLTVRLLLGTDFTSETFDKLAVPTTAWRAADGSIRVVAANGSRDAASVALDLRRIGLYGARRLVDVRSGEVFRPDANGHIVVSVAGGSGRLLAPVR